ncbi:hypothetical protein O6H91_17G033900 [Diphasiastrum complanatum]|uniref:Uncharacterized protein n=1 Tax=Diphasiastrum complanatum TaxID=34168 RepID=A0ACC2B5I2_DIPCM|nr:hypothetical protein O6H91_17G033900 [Diphasiastrum complanatum]
MEEGTEGTSFDSTLKRRKQRHGFQAEGEPWSRMKTTIESGGKEMENPMLDYRTRQNHGHSNDQDTQQTAKYTCSEDDEAQNEGHEEHRVGSDAIEGSIQLIRQKIDNFTQQVSGLLEAGKSFFLEIANGFEESIVQLHQKQIEKWEEEIQSVRNIDSLNEDINYRLLNAQSLINKVQMVDFSN